MAEIKIEKKKKPVWPWILGLLLLVLLAWGAYEVFDEDRTEMAATETVTDTRDFTEPEPVVTEEPAPQTGRNGGAVSEFVNFAEDTANMGLDHEYTSEGLNKLADALNEVASEAGVQKEQIEPQLDQIKSKADFIQKDPESLKHADSIRVAFTSATEVMETIQEQQFPERSQDIDELKQQAQEVSTVQQTLDQRKEVKEFFDQSAETLEVFAQNTEG